MFTARVKAPFTVESKEMAAPPELVSAVAAVRLTASLKVWAPVVVTFAPMLVVPPTLVVTLTTVGPTTPAKVVAPVVFTARVKAPFTVEFREMAAPPELVSAVAAVRLTASLKVWAPVVVTFAPMLVVPRRWSSRSPPSDPPRREGRGPGGVHREGEGTVHRGVQGDGGAPRARKRRCRRQAHRVVEGLGSRGGHVRADARRTPDVGRHAHHRRTHHAGEVVASVVFTVRSKPPSTVEPKAMARLPVLESVVAPARVTALL